MTDQVLQQELSVYLGFLNRSQKESILSMIKSFLQEVKTPARISIEQYNKEIEEAEARVQNGQYIGHEELEKESEKW